MLRMLPPALALSLCIASGVLAAEPEQPKYSGTFVQKGETVFTDFKIFKADGRSDAHLHLIVGGTVCKYLLETYQEDSFQTRKTVRFQGSKVDCELKRAGTVIGVLEFQKGKPSGQIKLVGDGKSLNFQIQSAAAQ